MWAWLQLFEFVCSLYMGASIPLFVLIYQNFLFKLKFLYLYTIIGEYTCDYLLRIGVICGHTCHRPEGCHENWNAKKRFPCKVCSKPTSSKPGLCRKYTKGYYVT